MVAVYEYKYIGEKEKKKATFLENAQNLRKERRTGELCGHFHHPTSHHFRSDNGGRQRG